MFHRWFGPVVTAIAAGLALTIGKVSFVPANYAEMRLDCIY